MFKWLLYCYFSYFFSQGTMAGFVSLATIGNIPTVLWNDIEVGYVYLRQTSDSSATALSSQLFLIDQGSYNQ